MALVSVVLVLTVLLTLAHILTEKVWQSTRQTGRCRSIASRFSGRRRPELNRHGSDWPQSYPGSGRLAELADGNHCTGLPGSAGLGHRDQRRRRSKFTCATTRTVTAMLRKDNDLKIFVLARARGRQGHRGHDRKPLRFRACRAAGPGGRTVLSTDCARCRSVRSTGQHLRDRRLRECVACLN